MSSHRNRLRSFIRNKGHSIFRNFVQVVNERKIPENYQKLLGKQTITSELRQRTNAVV